MSEPMNILVGCEFSGAVRSQLRKQGHNAWSCDLIPASDDSPHHIQRDVLEVIKDGCWVCPDSLHHFHNTHHPDATRCPWDLLIAFPPCTYLCNMALWWNHKRPERWQHTEAAITFVQALMDAPIDRIAVENPVGILSTRIRKPDQYIQPFHHGDDATKRTCLWLKNLPLLEKTQVVSEGKFYVRKTGQRVGQRMAAWSHITSGTRKAERARIAATTFPGIASAMAKQWGGSILPWA